MVVRLTAVALFCSFGLNAALAAPSRILILRHGEKVDVWKLCRIGQERAAALAANYLGRDAANSPFLRATDLRPSLPSRCLRLSSLRQRPRPGLCR